MLMFALVGGLLALLPYAIEKGAVSWLQQHGVADARIGNIDLNLFSGEALVEGLQSGDGLNIDHLRIDFDWLPLWHHIVHIRSLKLSQSNLHVLEQQGIWQVVGIEAKSGQPDSAAAQTSEQDKAWLVVVDDLLLEAVNVNVKTDLFAFSLPLKSLHLSLSALQQQQQHMLNHIEIGDAIFSGFGYSLSLAGATMAAEIAFSLQNTDILATLQTKKLSFALRGLEIDDTHDKRQISVSKLKFDGMALVDTNRIHVQSTVLEKLHIRHALNGQGDVHLAGMQMHGLDADMNAGMDGDITVAKLMLHKLSATSVDGHRQSVSIAETELADIAMSPAKQLAKQSDKHAAQQVHIKSMQMKNIAVNDALDAGGKLSLKKLKLAGLNVGFDGSVALAKLSLNHLQTEALNPDNHSVRLESAKLAGLGIDSEAAIDLKTLTMHKLELLGSNPSTSDARQPIAALDHASLQQFTMRSPESGSFASLTLEGIQLPSDDAISLGSIGRVQLRNAVLAAGGAYRVKRLQINQLQAYLVKQKEGWLLPAAIAGKKPERIAQQGVMPLAAATPSGSTGSAVSDSATAQLVIDSVVIGAGSRIVVHDASVTPALTTTMQIKKFSFAPLDSSGKQRGKLDVQMQLEKSGALSLNGEMNIAEAKQLRADMHLVLENFDLPRLSGYVEADLGKSIKTGQLNLDSDISIKDNSIDSKNKLLIRKLELKDSQHAHPSGAKLGLAGGMSIDMALGMLQDDRGDIKLNMPVSGPLDDPNINLGHIINKALLVSLKTGALTYAALALQPYGSIILVADVARGFIKDAVKPKLTPITFAERKSALTPAMNDYLAKIASLITKKDFRLQVCGIATRIEGEKIMQPMPEPTAGQTASGYVVEPALAEKQLLELAQQRSDVVVAALHARGIAAKQVYNCHPGIDESKQQVQARVELLLDY
ncbi:MAG: DUF748 domain-containing protein [Mariprofundus sp.]|nr:DUF748 domain-containing protein [Mariprofundus sp.]